MLSIDPTAMLEQQKKEKSESKQMKISRTFVFSLLGALLGAAICVLLDFVFIGSVTGIFYLLVGMSSYAFYLYFVQRKDQRKIHILIIAIACLLVTVLSVFVECMILHASEVQNVEMNIFEKTIELYRQNISANGFANKAHQTVGGEVLYYSLSILSIHTMCAFVAEVGFFVTCGVLSLATKSWEKKHGQENAEYGYSTRKTRNTNKKAKGKNRR